MPVTPVSLFLVMLVDAHDFPVAPPFSCTFPGDDSELADHLAEIFSDDDDVHSALIGLISSDPEEIADFILAADDDPFGDCNCVPAYV